VLAAAYDNVAGTNQVHRACLALLGYLLQGLGNHGLWLAFTLFMASRGIGMHIGYRRWVLPANA
jgi:Na+-driven multidrug efflux pump